MGRRRGRVHNGTTRFPHSHRSPCTAGRCPRSGKADVYSPHTPRGRVSARATTVNALLVVAVCAALFVAMRYTRPHDTTGALLLLSAFLAAGALVVMARLASRRDPLLRLGPGWAQECPAGEPACSLPEGHHGSQRDRRNQQQFPPDLTGVVSGTTFYRDQHGHVGAIHDAF